MRVSFTTIMLSTALAALGCSDSEMTTGTGGGGGETPLEPTHSGIIAIHEMPDHGIAISMLFREQRAPYIDERPGSHEGCKAWVYDFDDELAPALTDQGEVEIAGLLGGPHACDFDAESGYVCPTLVGSSPSDPFDPGGVTIALTAGGARSFQAAELGPVVPGEAFELDLSTRERITSMPLDATPVTLGCAGKGGTCGSAEATLVRITTTDGDTTGLPPDAMPPAIGRQMEIQCAAVGGDGSVELSSAIMGLMALVHADTPFTRVRTAFMRDGVAVAENRPPAAPNQLVVAVGRGVLGFTNPVAKHERGH